MGVDLASVLVALLAQLAGGGAGADAAGGGGDSGGGGAGGLEVLRGLLLAAGMASLVWVMLRLQWKRQRAGRADSPVEHMRGYIADRERASAQAAEMADIVRELAARLENRAARVEALLDQADERIAQLESRLGASVRPWEHPPLASPDAPDDAPPASNPDHPRAPDADDLWHPAGAAEHVREDRHPADARRDPLHAEVYELFDGGHSPLEIARRLEQQVGTIELILALRR